MQRRNPFSARALFFDRKIGIKILAGYLLTILLGALAGVADADTPCPTAAISTLT